MRAAKDLADMGPGGDIAISPLFACLNPSRIPGHLLTRHRDVPSLAKASASPRDTSKSAHLRQYFAGDN
jgi:hypothetical protein